MIGAQNRTEVFKALIEPHNIFPYILWAYVVVIVVADGVDHLAEANLKP